MVRLHITLALNNPKIIHAVLINVRRAICINNMISYFCVKGSFFTGKLIFASYFCFRIFKNGYFLRSVDTFHWHILSNISIMHIISSSLSKREICIVLFIYLRFPKVENLSNLLSNLSRDFFLKIKQLKF